jgi:N,N-dimethylformamidase beta subunit-like protein
MTRIGAAVAVLLLLTACTPGSHRRSPTNSARTSTQSTPASSGSAHNPSDASADLAGSPWRITPQHAGGISGYANPISVLPGQSVTLYVSTSAPTFRVRAFRMGWYRGMEGRQIWRSAPIRAHHQPAPVMKPAATHTVETYWHPSLTVRTSGWTPGDYLLRLDASNGHQSFVPLTVRAPSARGKIVIISPVTTWQAYDTWGCCDLYAGADGSFGSRARAVSFDRPYTMQNGAGEFLRGQLGVVAEAERLRLPLDYVTDVDLQTIPHLLAGARAVVSVGHDEYWSPQMRAAVTAARNAGTNLAFLGANAIFRRIRFGSTHLGPDRLIINYKVASEDPLYGHDNAAVTADWPAPPHPRPESSLLGAQYACLPHSAHVAGVVADPVPWLFAGTSAHVGERLPGLIGTETDAVQLGYPTPRPIQVLLHSPTNCPNDAPAFADATYYVASSGAGVFDAGTIAWSCAVGPSCPPVRGQTHRVVRTVTDNLLTSFARGPAGYAHPAHDNLAHLHISGH